MMKNDFSIFEQKFSDDGDLEKQQELQRTKELLIKYLAKDNTPERKELLKAFNDGARMTGPDGIRKKLAAFDLEYFGRAYFPHYFVRKSPEFHRELDEIWKKGVLKNKNPLMLKDEISRMKGCKRAIAAPRGHAKSTNFTFKDSVHSILYQYKHYILILSDSTDQAEGFLGDIKIEFEDNKELIEDFGTLQSNKYWTQSGILTTGDVKVEAIGSGKKVRGRKHRNWRPDLIILDDVENDENVNTPEQRNKLANWYFKAVSKAGDDYTDIVYIGTLLHYDSLLAKVLKNPGYKSVKYKAVIGFAKNQSLWDMWETIYTNLENDNREEEAIEFFEENKEEMLEGTQVLWEEKLSYYDLMVMKVTEGEASFNSEEQNEPIDPSSCLFNEEWLDYYDEMQIDFKDKDFVFVGAVDPSLGKNKKSDYSSIIVLAKHLKTGYMYVFEASIEKRKPDVIIEDTIESQRRLQRDVYNVYTKVGVESIQFQYFFKDQMAKESARQNVYLPIEEIYNTSDKKLRIQSLQPYIKNGYIKFNAKHKTLLRQLKNYPMDAHDDGPDCLEMAVKIAEKISGSTSVKYKSVLKRLFSSKGAY